MMFKKDFLITIILTFLLIGCGIQKSNDQAKPYLANVYNLSGKKVSVSENDLKRWSHLDIYKDTIPGMSVDRAYQELLVGKTFEKVIVGVIDSGIDVEHEDLKSAIWINKGEKDGDGIDNDSNGFVDDIHGWNFLGKIDKEYYEFERILKNKSLVDNATYQNAIDAAQKKKQEDEEGKALLGAFYNAMLSIDEIVAKFLQKNRYTIDDVKSIESADPKVMEAKAAILEMEEKGTSFAQEKEELRIEIEKINSVANKSYNNDYRKVLGDNPNDLNDVKYGDPNVKGGNKNSSLHGTHVSGIIAQTRKNDKGGDGIASEQVEIMCLRAVPDGDEYDKDIALAIRYAVDNGAKVINGSFGKYFSMQKEWVKDAMKYAASKDVLLVFAAGNDSYDLDKVNKYPSDSYDNEPEFVDNTLVIGSITPKYGIEMLSDFSNFGKNNVDIFAPGSEIFATTPSNNYSFLQGTSMASPNAAGVAALIRAYYPNLKAHQVKKIIMESGISFPNLKVKSGKDGHVVFFSEVSKSGKIVNAYNAILMADKISKH